MREKYVRILPRPARQARGFVMSRRLMPSPEYGWTHQQERARWVKRMETETIICRRASNGTCIGDTQAIKPGDLWDLGHPDGECSAPLAPEHRRCNRATAGRQHEVARWVL